MMLPSSPLSPLSPIASTPTFSFNTQVKQRPDPLGLLTSLPKPNGESTQLLLSETCKEAIHQHLLQALEDAAHVAQDIYHGPSTVDAGDQHVLYSGDLNVLANLVYRVLEGRVQAMVKVVQGEEHRTGRHREAVHQYGTRVGQQEMLIEHLKAQLQLLHEQLLRYQRKKDENDTEEDADTKVRTMYDQLTGDFRAATNQMSERLNSALNENRALRDANMRLEQRLESQSATEQAKQKAMFLDRVALLHLRTQVKNLREAHHHLCRVASSMRHIASTAFSALQSVYHEAGQDSEGSVLLQGVARPRSPLPTNCHLPAHLDRQSSHLPTESSKILTGHAKQVRLVDQESASRVPPTGDKINRETQLLNACGLYDLPAVPVDDTFAPAVSRSALVIRERMRKRGTGELAADMFEFNKSLYDVTVPEPPKLRTQYKFELQHPQSPTILNTGQPAYIMDRMTMELKKYVKAMNAQFAALPYKQPPASPKPSSPSVVPVGRHGRPRQSSPTRSHASKVKGVVPFPADGDLGSDGHAVLPEIPSHFLSPSSSRLRNFVAMFCHSTQHLLTSFADDGAWWERLDETVLETSDESLMQMLLALYHFLRHAMGLSASAREELNAELSKTHSKDNAAVPVPTSIPQPSSFPTRRPPVTGKLNPLRNSSPPAARAGPPTMSPAPLPVVNMHTRWDSNAVTKEPFCPSSVTRPSPSLSKSLRDTANRRPFNQSLFQTGKLAPPQAPLLLKDDTMQAEEEDFEKWQALPV